MTRKNENSGSQALFIDFLIYNITSGVVEILLLLLSQSRCCNQHFATSMLQPRFYNQAVATNMLILQPAYYNKDFTTNMMQCCNQHVATNVLQPSCCNQHVPSKIL